MTGQETHISEPGAALDEVSSSETRSQGMEVSLLDVLTQLALRKRLVAKVTGVAILVGVLLCLILPVQYTAVTKLMPPQQAPSAATLLMNQLSGTGAGSLAAMAGAGLGLKSPNDIYIGLLESRPIADAIIQKFSLATVYHAKDMTTARKTLADNTEITSEKDGFITVSVADRDKNRVAQMANAYTDELRILTKTLAVSEASKRAFFYEDQLKQAKEALVVAESDFQQVQQKKGLVQLDAQARAMIESLAALRAQVAAKQVEVQALRSEQTENNPQLELAESELSSLQGEVARLEQRNHSSGFSNLGLEDVPGAGLDYLRAQRELQYRQALYDMLLKQYDAAKLDEAKDATIIQVVEPAIVPDRKSSPKRAIILLLSTFVGFFAGCLLALFRWWRELIQTDQHLTRQLQDFKFALSGRKSTKNVRA